MKITLEYNQDELEDAKLAINARRYSHCIDDIWNNVFRPAMKHGYGDELLDSEQAHKVIEELAEIYRSTVNEWIHDET